MLNIQNKNISSSCQVMVKKEMFGKRIRQTSSQSPSCLTYEETRSVLKLFLENVVCDAVTYTEHPKRKIVTALDFVYTLKRQGRTLYGFGDRNCPRRET